MVKTILELNEKLDFWFRYDIDGVDLHNKSASVDINLSLTNDWHVRGPLGIPTNAEVTKVCKYINDNVFKQRLIDLFNESYNVKTNTRSMVCLRIAVNMIDKIKIQRNLKDKWIAHIQDMYWARDSACWNYYCDHYLPF
jgi:hypothetical protein